MTYIDGMVTAVPQANRKAYIEHASKAADMLKSWGATRVVENWGDDVPTGENTDFQRAVQAKDDEVIVFSWIEYPDKATRDAAMKKMMTPEAMKEFGEMPFDGRRMIFGGFETLFVK
ncbi:DUF1428 domain-containing protein [Devosia sp. CAU 1758]